jgi:putative membrane protein
MALLRGSSGFPARFDHYFTEVVVKDPMKVWLNTFVLALAIVAIIVAALYHLAAFVMESVLWTRPAVWRRFGLASQADADTIKTMALNQGFYNLFLALGAVAGVVAVGLGHRTVGVTLMAFAAACMLGAGLVLVATAGRPMLRAALLQAGPPVVALIGLAVA